MITRYGMSEKFGLTGLERAANQYLDNQTVLDCSEVTQAEVDKEITAMLKKAYKEAKDMLTANRSILDHIAAFLIEKETITGKEFMKIFREIKGIPEPEEESTKKSFMEQAMEMNRIYKNRKAIILFADLDGATGLKRFSKITFPLLAPSFTINMVLSAKGYLMVYDQIMAMTDGGPGTATTSIAVLIYKKGFGGGQFAYQSANAVVLFIVVVLISVFQLRILEKREEKLG